MAAVHSSDATTAGPEGVPRISPRAALATCDTGLTFTQACSQPGSLPTGTNTLLPNASGKIIARLRPWMASGVLATTPISTATQQIANENSMISPQPASQSSGGPGGREAMTAPMANTR